MRKQDYLRKIAVDIKKGYGGIDIAIYEEDENELIEYFKKKYHDFIYKYSVDEHAINLPYAHRHISIDFNKPEYNKNNQ